MKVVLTFEFETKDAVRAGFARDDAQDAIDQHADGMVITTLVIPVEEEEQ